MKSLDLDCDDPGNFKDCDLMLFDKVIAFDNLRQKIVLIGNVRLDNIDEDYPKVTSDLESLKFNTCISALMVYFNKLSSIKTVCEEDFTAFLTLLHPFAPHITDELWNRAGHDESLMQHSWPEADEKIIASRMLEIPVQINGKVKVKMQVKDGTSKEELHALALEKAKAFTEGKTVAKVIVVPGRLVSLVVK